MDVQAHFENIRDAIRRALAVALAIRFQHGLKRSDTFKLRPGTLARFGIGRKAGYRALEQLQQAGLIRVRRQQGQAAEVTLLKVGRNATGQGQDDKRSPEPFT